MIPTTQHNSAQSHTYSPPRDSSQLKTRKKTVSLTVSSASSSVVDEPGRKKYGLQQRVNGVGDFLSQMLANSILGYCQNHDLKSIKKLLEQYPHIDLEHQDWRGMTAWVVCASMGFNEGIRFLAEKAVNIHATDMSGNDAFLVAVEKGHISTIQLLLSLGVVDVCVTNGHGHNAISIAIQSLQSSSLETMLQLLYSLGTDIYHVDEDGVCPVNLAIKNKNDFAISSLFVRYADFPTETSVSEANVTP